MVDFYSLLMVFGIICFLIGIIIIILVKRFLRTKPIRFTITALVFVIGGLGIVIFLTMFSSSTNSQGEYISKMLNLDQEEIQLFTIYDRNNVESSVTEFMDQRLIKEWVVALKSCRSFNPNHPKYEEKYMVKIDYSDSSRFLYELAVDTRSDNAVDLKLLKKSDLGSGFTNLGYYKCNGLPEIISELSQ